MNRRTIAAYGIGGAALGTAWAAGLSLASSRGDSTLEVIGSKKAQFALLNTRRFRALFVIGSPDSELQENISRLTGMFRPRLDLVVGSRSGIDAIGTTFAESHQVARTIALDDPFGASDPGADFASIPSDLKAKLPQGLELGIHTIATGGWDRRRTERRSWFVEIRCGEIVCCMGPSLEDIATYGPIGPPLALAPTGDLQFSARRLGGSVIAINADETNEGDFDPMADGPPIRLTRIHPRDTAVFSLSAEGLGIPSWTEDRGILPS